MGNRPCIPFLTDHCVPDSVGNALSAAGHQVVRLRDCMPKDSEDQVVAIACAVHGYVLVTHDKDFKEIAKRMGITQRQYQRLHRVSFVRCSEVKAASRIKEALSLIENEWDNAQVRPDGKMTIEVSEQFFRTYR